ncbi:MAG: PBSX family phage terminase large subunit [Geothrix sp.]
MTRKVELDFPDAMSFLLEGKARYRVAYGGRGSSKSWSAARALILLAMKGRIRILCAREIQRSIKDSVHRLLSDQIEAMGLGEFFEILQAEIKCTRTGSQFIFAGLANTTAESLKSIENIAVAWIEEAQTVSDRSWEILIPTIRAAGSEIWVTFNPSEASDPTYQRFVVNPPPDAIVRRVNWDDNPWFPEELRREKDYLYSVDPETADHVWGGGVRKMSDAQILRGRYRVQSFAPNPDTWDGPYHGIDFGFAQDLGIMLRLWIWEGNLYVEYEAAGLEVETDLLPALWDTIPGARDYIARADCSRPETISQVKRLGYKRVIGCAKWPGCEQDGIEHLRSYQSIIVHPRCQETAREFGLWSWKRDRLTGDILPQTTGKFDNAASAARYALEPVIMGRLKKHPKKAIDPIQEEFPGMVIGRTQHGWMR